MSDGTTNRKPYQLRATEYFIVGTIGVMWLINPLTLNEDQWLIRATASRGNFFYDIKNKKWVLAGKDPLEIEKLSRTLKQCKAVIEEAESKFTEIN